MDRNWRALRNVLMASCSLSLLGLVSVAHAAGAPPADAPVSTSDSTAQVADIVVTAQKRQEHLVDVPLSVNPVNSGQLERQNITSLTDLSRAVPSFGDNGSIRGISTGGAARSSQGAVAVVLDGVDLGHPAVGSPQISSLFDVERIEVLSGPQATLFGASASAGVINITTKAPDPTRFEAIGHVDAGDYGYQRDRLTLNVPLSDKAAVRVSLHHDEDHGVVRNTVSGQVPESHDDGIRARLLWKPSDDLRINLIADYDRGGANGQNDIAFAVAPTTALQTQLAACGIVASLSNTQNCPLGISSVPQRDVKYGFSGQIDYDHAGFRFTSITAYRSHVRGDFGYNGPGGDSDFLKSNILDTNLTPEDDKSFTQEFRLTSPVGQRLEYVAGLYFTDLKQHDQVIQAGGLGLLPPPYQLGRVNIIHIKEQSYAAFGQATFHITDKLSLIGGARATHESDKDVSVSLTDTTTPSLTSYGYLYNPAFILAPVNASAKTDNFSWKIGAEYQWNRDLMGYATITRGYKGPAINDQASPPITQAIIAPEIPMNYEVGMKAGFLHNRLIATAALFYDKIKDFQTSVYIPPTAANPVGNFAQGNAPYIITKGIDLNILGRPLPELTLNAGLLYNQATYASSFLVPCSPQQTPGVGSCTAGGVTPPVSQLAGTPKWRILLNGEYAKEIRSGLTAFVQSDLTYESAQFTTSSRDPITDQPEHWLLGGRIGIRSTDGRWGLSIFGRNLLNNNYATVSQDALSGFDGGAGKSYWVSPTVANRRTWGVTLDAKF